MQREYSSPVEAAAACLQHPGCTAQDLASIPSSSAVLAPLFPDPSPFELDPVCRPWPHIEEFDPDTAAVGSTGPFEWVASGTTVLLWDVLHDRFVTLRETEAAVLDVLAVRVAGSGETYWVFLLTADGVAWAAVDDDAGLVSSMGWAAVAAGQRLLDVAGRVVVVHRDANVSLLAPDVAASSIAVAKSQSWGAWIKSWYAPAVLVDAAPDGARRAAVTLDTTARLIGWDVSGDHNPCVLWSVSVDCPKPLAALYVARSAVVCVAADGGRFVADIQQLMLPDGLRRSSATTVSMHDEHGSFGAPVSVVKRVGSVTAVVVGDGGGGRADDRRTLLCVEGVPLLSGRAAVHDLTTPFAADVQPRAVGVRYDPATGEYVVTVAGLLGVSCARVRSTAGVIASLAGRNALPSRLEPLLETTPASPEVWCRVAFAAAECAMRSRDEAAVRVLRSFVNPLGLPSRRREATSAGRSEESLGMSALVRTFTALVKKSPGDRLAVADDVPAACAAAAASGAARPWLEQIGCAVALGDALLVDGGWTHCPHATAAPAAETWRVDGAANVCVARRSSSGDHHNNGAWPRDEQQAVLEGINVQARFAEAVFGIARRMHILLRLSERCVQALGHVPAAAQPISMAAVGSDDAAVLQLVVNIATKLCEASPDDNNFVLEMLPMLPPVVTNIASAWALAWHPESRADALDFVRAHAFDLWNCAALDALRRRVCALRTDHFLIAGSLFESPAATREAKHCATDLMLSLAADMLGDDDLLARHATFIWRELPTAMRRRFAVWLIEHETRDDGLELAKIYATAPAEASHARSDGPSVCLATYLEQHGEPQKAADMFAAVAEAEGTALRRRAECVAKAISCAAQAASTAAGANQQQQLEQQQAGYTMLKESIDIQREMFNIAQRHAKLTEDDEELEVAQQHVLVLDSALLGPAELYSVAQQYRAVGGGFVEVKLLAREPNVQERAWAEAIDACVSHALSTPSPPHESQAAAVPRVVEELCGAIVREAKECRAVHLPLHYLLSVLEGYCRRDPERLQCLLRAEATVDEIFDGYLTLLEDARALIHPSCEITAAQLLLVMSEFVTRSIDFAQPDVVKRMFTAVDARVKKMGAALRVRAMVLAPGDEEALRNAAEILDRCEDAIAGTGMGGAMTSQQSWVF